MSDVPLTNVPVFAVVGRVNKGKSSVVATLAEDDSVRIERLARTTTACRPYHVELDGERLFDLVDTPGFNQAARALAWMKERCRSAAERAGTVRRFVEEHERAGEFHDECELLRPILDGAAILYVVDGTKPYRPNYDAEMEILLWTGRPSMALVNRIGDEDHGAEWRAALHQYFSTIRDFDAHAATFGERCRLLEIFGTLHEPWAARLTRVVGALRVEREGRRVEAARLVTDLLVTTLALTLTEVLDPRTLDDARVRRDLEHRFHGALEQAERRSREALKSVYRHERMVWEGGGLAAHSEVSRPDFAQSLFSEASWQSLGLGPLQLMAAGVGTGAAAGATFDLAVGQASLGAGMVLGGLLGALGAGAHLSQRYASVSELGAGLLRSFRSSPDDRTLEIGPHPNPNFPWVVLDRTLLFFRALLYRTHAQREALRLDDAADQSLVATIEGGERKTLARLFDKIRRQSPDVTPALRSELYGRVTALLARVEEEVERGRPTAPAS